MAYNYKILQNGSDIRGVALPLNKEEPVTLTTDIAKNIGKAFISWLTEYTNTKAPDLKIGVGMDSRLSGPAIKTAFIDGITSKGAKICDFNLATTPAMFMSTQFEETNCDGAVMLTASHLPPNRNGMKFFTRNSGLEKQDITKILGIAESGNFIEDSDKGEVITSDIITPYSLFLTEFIQNKTSEEKPLSGLNIIVDAGNGAGGFFAEKILKPLGADINGSLFLEPDGNFPNHAPNPEDKTAIEFIQKAVIENSADFGIIFDTDVDRAAVIDKEGNPINRNALIALLSTIVLKENPETCIVTDSVTSDGLTTFIESLNGVHHRFKRGYRNVINESIRLNNSGQESWLAIETSGHAAFRQNYFLDDGAYLVAKVLITLAQMHKQNKSINTLISDLRQPAESSEFRIKIDTDEFIAYGNEVIESLKTYVKKQHGWSPAENNYEGYRVSCDSDNGDGWFLLRLSLHDPVLPLNIESNTAGGIKVIAEKLEPFLSKFDKLKNIQLT